MTSTKSVSDECAIIPKIHETAKKQPQPQQQQLTLKLMNNQESARKYTRPRDDGNGIEKEKEGRVGGRVCVCAYKQKID